jgi:hypothetical protein
MDSTKQVTGWSFHQGTRHERSILALVCVGVPLPTGYATRALAELGSAVIPVASSVSRRSTIRVGANTPKLSIAVAPALSDTILISAGEWRRSGALHRRVAHYHRVTTPRECAYKPYQHPALMHRDTHRHPSMRSLQHALTVCKSLTNTFVELRRCIIASISASCRLTGVGAAVGEVLWDTKAASQEETSHSKLNLIIYNGCQTEPYHL